MEKPCPQRDRSTKKVCSMLTVAMIHCEGHRLSFSFCIINVTHSLFVWSVQGRGPVGSGPQISSQGHAGLHPTTVRAARGQCAVPSQRAEPAPTPARPTRRHGGGGPRVDGPLHGSGGPAEARGERILLVLHGMVYLLRLVLCYFKWIR